MCILHVICPHLEFSFFSVIDATAAAAAVTTVARLQKNYKM